MENIFIQSSGLLAIIILGYLMKRLNLLSKKDGIGYLLLSCI